MEIGFPEAVATLIAMADGSISLYFSSGGGRIGLGQVPGPRAATDAWLEAAQPFAGMAAKVTSFPLPTPYFVRFYLLTARGVRSIEAKEEDLYERHSFAPLFHKGQDLLSKIRLMDEPAATKRLAPGTHRTAPKASISCPIFDRAAATKRLAPGTGTKGDFQWFVVCFVYARNGLKRAARTGEWHVKRGLPQKAKVGSLFGDEMIELERIEP